MNDFNTSQSITCALDSADLNRGKIIKIFAVISLIFFAFIELYFFKLHYHIIGYAGSAVVILFGIWRIATEKHPYQRFRIIVILSTFVLFWGIIPLAFNAKVPIIGGQWGNFPAVHTVGSLTFFSTSRPCSCSAGGLTAAGAARALPRGKPSAIRSGTKRPALNGGGACVI